MNVGGGVGEGSTVEVAVPVANIGVSVGGIVVWVADGKTVTRAKEAFSGTTVGFCVGELLGLGGAAVAAGLLVAVAGRVAGGGSAARMASAGWHAAMNGKIHKMSKPIIRGIQNALNRLKD